MFWVFKDEGWQVRVQVFRFRIYGSNFRFQASDFRFQGSGCRFEGSVFDKLGCVVSSVCNKDHRGWNDVILVQSGSKLVFTCAKGWSIFHVCQHGSRWYKGIVPYAWHSHQRRPQNFPHPRHWESTDPHGRFGSRLQVFFLFFFFCFSTALSTNWSHLILSQLSENSQINWFFCGNQDRSDRVSDFTRWWYFLTISDSKSSRVASFLMTQQRTTFRRRDPVRAAERPVVAETIRSLLVLSDDFLGKRELNSRLPNTSYRNRSSWYLQKSLTSAILFKSIACFDFHLSRYRSDKTWLRFMTLSTIALRTISYVV